MLRSSRRRALLACVVSCMGALATAPAALSATLTNEGGTLTYTSESPTANNSVYFRHGSEAGTIHVFDNYHAEPITSTDPDCVATDAYNWICSGDYTATEMNLGGGNDNGDNWIPLPTTMNAGPGHDGLHFWPQTPAEEPVPTAGTLNGDAGEDWLNSGAGDQTLNGGDDQDWGLYGGDGNDTLNGGAGNDYYFYGQNGDDVINGGPGSDSYMYGDDGNDTINGGDGDDYWLDGGNGDDTLNGGAGEDYLVDYEGDARWDGDPNGNDTLNGDGGNDTICDGQGNETINGGDGNDDIGYNDDNGSCWGGYIDGEGGAEGGSSDSPARGTNTIDGGAGDDEISGGTGEDLIRGGDGDDQIWGSPGNDRVEGGAGRDSFLEDHSWYVIDGTDGDYTTVRNIGDSGSDTYVGGAGRDYAEFDSRDTDDNGHDDNITISLDGVANDGSPGENDNVGADVEDIETGDGADTVTGSDVSNMLWTNSGNDTVDGRGGDDVVVGGADKDTVNGGDGNDDVYGDWGDGFFFGQVGPFDHQGNDGPDVVDGGNGNDNVYGGGGDDTLRGGDGNDGLYGGWGADDVTGGTGADFVDYTGYNDRVIVTLDDQANDGTLGEDDNVRSDVEDVIGGNGNDSITGSTAANTLSGGPGNDTINSRDTVSDLVICGPGVDTALVDNLDVVEDEGDDRCERVEVAQISTGTPPARVAPRGLSAAVSPKKDAKFPHTFRVRGVLSLPAGVSAADGCKGKVSVQFKIREATISRRVVTVGADCRYSSRVTFAVKRRLKGSKTLKVITRFQGNDRLLPKRAKNLRAGIRN